MIFQHTHEMIFDGSKTMTRRVVKDTESLGYTEWGRCVHFEKGNPRAYNSRKHIKWGVGRTYAVCPARGKSAIGRIKITGIRRENVADISESDAIAEGFASRDDFFDTWRSMHKTTDQDVWVLEFKLVQQPQTA